MLYIGKLEVGWAVAFPLADPCRAGKRKVRAFGARRQVMPGGREFMESATESKPPDRSYNQLHFRYNHEKLIEEMIR